jgi:sigma-E factor negative regulatory protein RseC
MMLSRVTVMARTPAGLEVQAAGPAGCARCAAGQGCGGGVFARLLGDRLQRVTVADQPDIPIGAAVLVGLDGRSLARAVLHAFGWPLAGLFLGAGLAGGAAEWQVALGAALGLASGWLVARWRVGRLATRLQPRIVAHGDAARTCE